MLAHVLSRSSGSVGFFCFPMFGRVPPNADRSSFRLFWFLLNDIVLLLLWRLRPCWFVVQRFSPLHVR